MIGKTLYYGKDWGDSDRIQILNPTNASPYWHLIIHYDDNRRLDVLTSHMVAVAEDTKIIEIHY